jgi:hypothetical protein
MKRVLYVLLFLSFFSCQKNHFTSEERAIYKLENIKLQRNAWIISNISEEEQAKISKSPKMAEFSKIIVENKNVSSEKLYVDFKAFISSIENPIERQNFSQMVVNYAFRNTALLDEPRSEKRSEIISYYTHLLLESQSGDAEILFNGLYNLKNIWSNDKIVKAIDNSEKNMLLHLNASQKLIDNNSNTNNETKSSKKDEGSLAQLQSSVTGKRLEMHKTYKERQLKAQKMIKRLRETIETQN